MQLISTFVDLIIWYSFIFSICVLVKRRDLTNLWVMTCNYLSPLCSCRDQTLLKLMLKMLVGQRSKLNYQNYLQEFSSMSLIIYRYGLNHDQTWSCHVFMQEFWIEFFTWVRLCEWHIQIFNGQVNQVCFSLLHCPCYFWSNKPIGLRTPQFS